MDLRYPDIDRCWWAFKREIMRKGNGLLWAGFSTDCIHWYGAWRFGD